VRWRQRRWAGGWRRRPAGDCGAGPNRGGSACRIIACSHAISQQELAHLCAAPRKQAPPLGSRLALHGHMHWRGGYRSHQIGVALQAPRDHPAISVGVVALLAHASSANWHRRSS
jgi:hypothetical protein